MISPRIKLGLSAVGGAGLLATAYLMVMTTFMIYDDEGFVLMSLRRFLGGEPLYDAVFSQYGPAPYLYHWLLTLGGTIELTHMFGRVVTVMHWVICAVSVGWISAQLVERYRFTTGVFAGLVSFNLLWQMIAEPTHPGSMIAACLAVTTALSVRAIAHQHYARLALILGCAGAILLFTKINVGAFFIAGTGAFALCYTTWPQRWSRLAEGLALASIALLPLLLMAGNLPDPTILMFALKASLGGAAIWWILPRVDRADGIPPATWGRTLGWFAGGSIILVGFVLLRGTSLAELVATVFIDPLRQPGNFVVAPRSSIHSAMVATVCFILVAWAGWEQRRTGELSPRVRQTVAAGRLALLAGFIWFSLRWPSPWGAFTYLDYVLPMLPLWLIRSGRGNAIQTAAIALLAFVAVTQVLHAYPVAGSQIGWGCFLSVAVFACCVQRDLLALRPKVVSVGMAGSLLVAAGLGTAILGQTGWERYRDSKPLPFAGAGDIRLDDRSRIALTMMVQNAMVHSDMLFTRQGMYSLNLFSEVATPTARNATHWFWLLDETEQQDIIHRLASTDRSAVIVSEVIDEFFVEFDVPVFGPLQDFIESHYVSAFKLRGFDFRVPAGREIAALGWARLMADAKASSGEEAPARLDLTLNVVIQGTPATVELVAFDSLGNAQPVGPALKAINYTPIRSDGAAMAAPKSLDSVGRLEGIYRFSAQTDLPASHWDFRNRGIVIKDAAGATLAEALFE